MFLYVLKTDDVLELKIVGVTSAVGKEEETKVRPEEVELKIDSVKGADQTQQKVISVVFNPLPDDKFWTVPD